MLYQVMHPWHWLGYEQNAAIVQALCALFGFILLFAYTVYTRRMMQLGENARRALITPVFTARKIIPHHFSDDSVAVNRVSMTIRNIGQGPAAAFWAWHQPVTSQFSPSKSEILRQSSSAQLVYVPENGLMSGESMEISFDAYNISYPSLTTKETGLMYAFPSDRRWLFVVDAIDQAGGRHQLQMLKEAGDGAPTDVKMVHALGETFGERLVKRVRRGVEILLAVKKEVLKLFS